MKSRPSLTDSAYKKIKGWILRGQILPNNQIEEQEIARRLSMSRTPVREALLRLQNESLIEIKRGSGIRVLSLSSTDMREIYQLITGLEALAVYLLAQRLHTKEPSPRTKEALAPLYEALDALDQAAAEGDMDAWGEADERFHRSLLQTCGNKRVAQTGTQFRDITQRAHLVAARLQTLEYKLKSVEAHRALADLILAGKADEARDLHFHQRMRGEQALVEALEKFGLLSL